MLYLILFVLGAVVGSFLNVCIYRLPRDMSIVMPPSHCPGCGARLSPFDMIPLFSYLFLRGKCRQCGKAISAKYPVVELITALVFVALSFIYGPTADLVFSLILISSLIVVFFADLETQIIPDQVSVVILGSGLAKFYFYGDLLGSLTGAIAGFILMYGFYRLGSALYKQEAMGGGDIKLAAALGAFFGWQSLLLCLFLSFLIGAVVSIALMAAKIKKRTDVIPFGPAMVMAAVIVLFLGKTILNIYYGIAV